MNNFILFTTYLIEPLREPEDSSIEYLFKQDNNWREEFDFGKKLKEFEPAKKEEGYLKIYRIRNTNIFGAFCVF